MNALAFKTQISIRKMIEQLILKKREAPYNCQFHDSKIDIDKNMTITFNLNYN